MLSKIAIDEYMEIYKQNFGENISRDEAERQGSQLLRLFRLIYRPIPKDWLIQSQERGETKHGH